MIGLRQGECEIRTASEYPKEVFLKIEGDDIREGRLTVMKQGAERFSVEADIVLKENQKIWKHLGMLFDLREEDEAVERGVDVVAKFLKYPHGDPHGQNF